MAQPLLRVEGVSARYGSMEVLHGISLELKSGELLLLAGPNGAGKSTLLRTLIGSHRISAGEVHLGDRSVTRLPPYTRARLGMAWIPEGRGVIPQLSVEENLDVAKFTPGWRRTRREASYQRFPVLARARRRAAGKLSGGEQQMLAIARSLETDPKVLLIDEPSLGLAPRIVKEVMDTLRSLRDEGRSILLVEQRAAQVQHVASRVLLLRQGHLSAAPADVEFTEMNFEAFTAHDIDQAVS